MRHRKRLCVDVVGARNLASSQSVDAYCIVELCDVKPNKYRTLSLASRSSTVSGSNNPEWAFVTEFVVPSRPASVRLRAQLFSERNFFFDMFPSNSSHNEEGSQRGSDECSRQEMIKLVSKPQIVMNGWVHDSDSDDVVTLSEEEDEDEKFGREDSVWPTRATDVVVAAENSQDERLGIVEITLSLLCKPSRVVTDAWYSLAGTRTGEVRIRTVCSDGVLTASDRDRLFEEHVHHLVAKPLKDFYGFTVVEAARREWVHLRSYQDCREERRAENWTRLYNSQLPEILRRCSYKDKDTEEKALLVQLAQSGIPRHLRQCAYMNLSGASEKKANAGPNYYVDLVQKAGTIETEAFRQIELDIDRTFGGSETIICSELGYAQLRRILRAYSLRNPIIGYCQGLNFIVAFFMLMTDEETVFWLLCALCEDFYSGYYSPSMSDIQLDMLVLKKLIAEELPQLDEFTSEIGLPLELLGSQWLLCLFTRTFPSETVFRIFDCIFTAGPTFVFPVSIAHLRQIEPTLLALDEFQGVLSSIKNAEKACIDGDLFMAVVCKEAEIVTADRIQQLREMQCGYLRSEMGRADRFLSLNQQLAFVYQIPACSTYVAGLLRFFHEEAAVSSRSDVSFVLTMLCHGLVWLAEHSKRWNR
ncbi:hypothetical protein PsorP6_003948 [Peronosclerospora sorghi]|uniref:Uncharacterized protein n=1 Tax=Peronosclerospora sorghi TaxID=230839 RepID=A0ACC0VR52_9STRA|nr:hypothetical protein PsorP6_003948 [Peronosclerospora sorghi]